MMLLAIFQDYQWSVICTYEGSDRGVGQFLIVIGGNDEKHGFKIIKFVI